MEYKINELREMISNLRLVKVFAGGLSDECEIDLVVYELLLENYQINEVMNGLSK